ncbi:MAG: glutathione S-transferase N-terminal domain-containing protein [Gammaproteobacteria bacterium]
MIDVYYWPTPNGHKITIFLEEVGLDYRVFPVNIKEGQQFEAAFLKIAPNNKIPAIVDHEPADKGEPLALFESGAILVYLAEKTRQFIPEDLRARSQVLQWLFWQMGGLGPILGQNHHFVQYAPEKIPYAIERYVKETKRLYTVLDLQLTNQDYICGAYSIVDMACFPWVMLYEKQLQNIADFPNIKRWLDKVQSREAVQRAYQIGQDEVYAVNKSLNSQEKQTLFQKDVCELLRKPKLEERK